MRILTVSGSPDRSGNSAKLLEALIQGVKSNDAVEIDSINVNDYKIAPVWKDYFGDALTNQTDKVKDDMPLLKEKMLAADIIVIASPIYWYQVSGKMKLFLDRWTDLINPDWSTDLAGKGLAFLSTHSGINVMNSSNIAQMAMMSTAQFLGMQWMGAVDSRARMPWGWNDEASIEAARIFGRSLGQGINLIGQPVISAGESTQSEVEELSSR